MCFPLSLGKPCPQWLPCSSPCVADSVSLCVHTPYMARIGLGACWLVERGLLCLSVNSHSEFPFQTPPCCVSPSLPPSLLADPLFRQAPPAHACTQNKQRSTAPFIQSDRFSSLASKILFHGLLFSCLYWCWKSVCLQSRALSPL